MIPWTQRDAISYKEWDDDLRAILALWPRGISALDTIPPVELAGRIYDMMSRWYTEETVRQLLMLSKSRWEKLKKHRIVEVALDKGEWEWITRVEDAKNKQIELGNWKAIEFELKGRRKDVYASDKVGVQIGNAMIVALPWKSVGAVVEWNSEQIDLSLPPTDDTGWDFE